MKLNDSNLFRQQALINGEWLDANNGEVIGRHQSGERRQAG